MGDRDSISGREPSWILYMGTFPPRECGIATFTKDLTNAMDKKFSPLIKSKIAAMNKNATSVYNYPEDVLFSIDDSNIQEYIDAAKKINKIDDIKIVNIQHEFGIFGGDYGNYLIPFLEILDKPVIITLHSILPDPDEKLKKVVQSIAKNTSCFVVMAKKAVELLREDYGIDNDITVVHHGIPSVSFCSNKSEKKKIGYGDKILLSSFGMMSSGKGYETVIESLPQVIKRFPNILYVIIGATHPVVRKNEGESYRNFLEKKVKDLGLQKNVKFYNKYVSLGEIINYLKASDIYICSNNDPNQIVSGTLAYAAGCGKATISTPFPHAKEVLENGRGFLAEFKEPDSFAKRILSLLSDKQLKREIEGRLYSYSRHMTWPNVAMAYTKLFDRYAGLSEDYTKIFPKIKLDHLINITDELGVIQFSRNVIPDKSSGYTLDDNARAMIVCCMHHSMFKDNSKLKLIKTYLKFINYVQRKNGRLLNFVDENKKIDPKWSEDAHGRAIWSLGFLSSSKTIPKEIRESAGKIFAKSIKLANKIKSPRAVAFMIMGLYFYNKAKKSSVNVNLMAKLADYLVSLYEHNQSANWAWFEERLTYSNSKLPESLFYAYIATKKKKYLKIAESTLAFLSSVTFKKGMFMPIGQKGWYLKNKSRAYFDQQPVDAGSMVQTLVLAYNTTKNKEYKENAIRSFHWFLGKNFLNYAVYDEFSGGCYDGIGQSAINLNQGAESTISYLIARLSLNSLKR